MKFKDIFKQVGIKNCDTCITQYRFKNPEEKIYQTRIYGYEFENEFIKIEKNAKITIKKDAGSDGCTPVYLVFNRFYLCIYNGPMIPTDSGIYEPITARSFYLHDWLLNVKELTGMPAHIIHQAFCNELNTTRFKPKRIYCYLVRKHGPKDILN